MTSPPPEEAYRRRFDAAVRTYWSVRAAQARRQADTGRLDVGTRGEVTAGAHLDAMAELVETIFVDEGIDPSSIRRRGQLNLPGFYRPTKDWDLLVIDRNRVIAAVEFKSQVGPSFGNNFNNRAEEALGNAVDLWRAYEAGLLGTLRPWVGYMMFLEEAAGSMSPVRIPPTVLPADSAFGAAPSYRERYEILLSRLYKERLYDAACLVTSSPDPSSPGLEPAPELSFRSFAAAIAARVMYIRRLG